MCGAQINLAEADLRRLLVARPPVAEHVRLLTGRPHDETQSAAVWFGNLIRIRLGLPALNIPMGELLHGGAPVAKGKHAVTKMVCLHLLPLCKINYDRHHGSQEKSAITGG